MMMMMMRPFTLRVETTLLNNNDTSIMSLTTSKFVSPAEVVTSYLKAYLQMSLVVAEHYEELSHEKQRHAHILV